MERKTWENYQSKDIEPAFDEEIDFWKLEVSYTALIFNWFIIRNM